MAFSLVALACLVGAAFAGPFQRNVEQQCATECPAGANEKFNYVPGKVYVYDYKGINYVSVIDNRKQQKAELQGTIEIYVKDRCEMSLQLKDMEMRSDQLTAEEIEELKQQLEKYPMSFAWVDGKIDHVCASPEDTPVSENIKKGILSAIINTMENLPTPTEHQEEDSLGLCNTKYDVIEQSGDNAIIRKEKSLKSCDNRHSGVTAFMTEQYQSPQSDIRTLPVFSDENLECRQEIRNRIIQRVVCQERAVIKPLSKYESIVEFQGEINLQLKDERSGSAPQRAQAQEKKSIRYTYLLKEDSESREREATQILREICPETENILNPVVSKLFYQLIVSMKSLSYESLQRIYDSLKNKQLCHSEKTLDLYLDALPMAGTEGSIKLMVRLLKTKEVTGLKAKLWPASFALIPSPNAEAISAVLPLLSEEEKSRPVLLGLSAMIYRVCVQTDCDQISEVRQAVDALHQSLGRDCSSQNDDEVISILKAFGNMGYFVPAQETVLACARSSDKPLIVRLAAIDAFRRYTKELPSAVADIFGSAEENFELRIAAVSTMIKNLDSRSVRIIQNVLENDKDEQVVAYTSSLVKNWQTTSSPLKRETKEQLKAIRINREDISYWQNSKNIELSYFNVPTNLGASVESDIIHESDSKIPRALSSRLDIDLFGSNINLVEFGIRAEGLEKAVKKLIGVDQQPASQQRKSWFPLTSQSTSEEDRPEVSLYLRTMGTEFLDLSISDVTSVGKMMKFADIVNKLAEGKKVDFAHSFLFLNTKLIIPSVTGRFYTFAMTGSATVGLSADGKFDIINLMSYPKNCDIGGRIQPSANVELATTVGIHSEKSRPDIKIVTSLHTEGNLAAKLQVKDSHLLEARVDMPNEEIQVLKISSELYEIDSRNNEKRIVQEMHSRFDHCFNTLEKPLGIQLCAKLETPHPYVSKTFPYTRGLGNFEISLKKTDPRMRSFVASIEIPKRKSDLMVYKAIADTPGSSINRKFQTFIELRRKSSGEREFKLNMECPFKELSTTGSYLWRSDRIQGSVNLLYDKSKRYSAKAVVEITTSGSEKTFKPTIQWTLPRSEPVTIAGSIVHSKKNKEHIMIDLRSNKQGARPIIFTGNLMKDGKLELSRSAQWKMSGDFVVKTPLLTTKLHTIVDKQTQSVSSSLSMDYETQRTGKQSISIASRLQQSSEKINYYTKLQTSQFPKCNLQVNWDMQGNLKKAMKNEIMLRYGEDPSRSFIRLAENHQIGDASSLTQGKIALEIPQLRINSELRAAADLHFRQTSNIHFEGDLRYKADKHIRSLVQLKHISKRPMKLAVKAELELPGLKAMYKDEIQEARPNIFEGRSVFQWQERQSATLRYTYKRLSDRSKIHHELESTLNAPVFQSPVQSKWIVKMNREEAQIKAQLKASSQSEYLLDAKLQKVGSSELILLSPKIEGKLLVENVEQRKEANLELKLKTRNPLRIAAKTALKLAQQKGLEVEVAWDADRKPSQKVAFSAELESQSRRDSLKIRSKVQIMDHLIADISCLGDKKIKGTHECSAQASGRKFDPIAINVQKTWSQDEIHSILKLKKKGIEKVSAELRGKLSKQSRGLQAELNMEVMSPDNSFEKKELHLIHSFIRSRSSVNLQTTVGMSLSSRKMHEAKLQFSSSDRELTELKINVKTPYQQYREQELGLVLRKSANSKTLEARLSSNSREISLISVLTATRSGHNIRWTLKTPFSPLREAMLYAGYENQATLKSIQTLLEINGDKKGDWSVSYESTSSKEAIQYRLKTSILPEVSFGAKCEGNARLPYDERSNNWVQSVINKVFKIVSSKDCSCELEAKSSKTVFADVKLFKEGERNSAKYTLKAKGKFTPISIVVQKIKNDENSVTISVDACKDSQDRLCYKTKAYYKFEKTSSKLFSKITFDLSRLSKRENLKHVCSVHYMISSEAKAITSKLTIEANGKTVGFHVNLKQRRDESDPCELTASLMLPSRTSRLSISVLHNSERSQYELEVNPDVSAPARKFSVQAKREVSGNKVAGHLQMSHQALNKPFMITYQLAKSRSNYPELAKIEIDYSRNPKDKITAELKVQAEGRQAEKTITYRLYTEGKDLDLTLKASMQRGRSTDMYSSEWSWKAESGLKSGGISLKLSDKVNGLPNTAELKYTSPRSQLTVNGHASWSTNAVLPIEAEIQLLSQSRAIFKIHYQKEDSCINVNVDKQAQSVKGHICISKKESNKFELISVQLECLNNRCLELAINVDPDRSQILNIIMNWDVQELKKISKMLIEPNRLLKDLPVRELRHELSLKSRMIGSSLKNEVGRPLANALKQEWRLIAREQEELVRKFKELIERIKKCLPDIPTLDELLEKLEKFIVEHMRPLWDKLIDYIERHAPKWLKDLLEKLKEKIDECMRKYCSRGSFCYRVKQTYKRGGLKELKKLLKSTINEKMEDVQKRSRRTIREASNKVSDFIDDLFHRWEKVEERVRGLWDYWLPSAKDNKYVKKAVELYTKSRDYLREISKEYLAKVMEIVDEWMDHARKHEDFKVLSSLFKKIQKEAEETWKDMEVEKMLEPLREGALVKIPKEWMKEKINIQDFDLREGKIRMQVHHPLDESKVQLLKNSLLAIKNKILQKK